MTLIIITGAIVGNVLNTQDAVARKPCENLACKWDYFGGFRCFDDGTEGYACDDSAYPSCSETRCGIE